MAGDRNQKRAGEVRIQGIRIAAEEGQMVRVMRELGVGEVASGFGAEIEDR